MKKTHVFIYSAASILLVFAAALHPIKASALTYSMGPVHITAKLDASGTLTVTEDRTYVFDGSSRGVYWKIPEGEHDGKMIQPQILSAGMLASTGDVTPFTRSLAGANRTYEISQENSAYSVKLYNLASGEVTYQICYVLPNVATRFADVSDFYWKFVSDGWDQTSNDVTCVITLPVPPGESIQGETNTWVFGHGPLEATASLTSSGATFYVPSVSSDMFAEARILFPVSWLSQAQVVDKPHLDEALSQEAEWMQAADTVRMWAKGALLAMFVLLLFIGIITCFVALKVYRLYKVRTRPTFQGTYMRDVPSSDHPAVLGCLYNGGHVGSTEMSATIMHLVDAQVLAFNTNQQEKTFKVNQKKLTILPYELDAQFAHDVLNLTNDETFSLTNLKKYAETHSEAYKQAIDSWVGAVKAEGIRRGFYTATQPVRKVSLVCWLIVCSLSIVAGVVLLYLCGAEWVFYFGILSPVLGVLIASMVLAKTPQRSAEAIELIAKLHALKRWLLNFTRLKEAVPQDVMLWNRLLIMAVVLSVSKEVLEQMKVACPEILQNPSFIYHYPWMWGFGPHRFFYSAISSGVYSSYRSTVASVAASAASSHGSGGGFSMGGGGGFGGGGGGGAF